MPIATKSFSQVLGDSFYVLFNFQNEDLTAKDVSAYTFRAILTKQSSTPVQVIFEDNEFVRPSVSSLEWDVPPNSLKAFELGVYKYILQVTYPNSVIKTWVKGTINVDNIY
jgi:hypothetical protein